MSGFRVCQKRCDQCLFSSAKVVDGDRKLDILRTCVEKDAHFICHKFTIAEGPGSQVCCRGFYDADPAATNLMRIAGRLGAVEFVDLPTELTPDSVPQQESVVAPEGFAASTSESDWDEAA